MSIDNQIETLRNQLETAKSDKVKAETQLEQVKTTLVEKYNVETVEGIEALIAEKQDKLNELTAQQLDMIAEAGDLLRAKV